MSVGNRGGEFYCGEGMTYVKTEKWETGKGK
jgi:hypothetical protein